MKIYSVSQVAVTKQSESPLILLIQAAGLTTSSGWTNPRLESSGAPNPEDAILEFSLEADRPAGITLPVLTPIHASLEVNPAQPVEAVVVEARTNSISVHVSQFASPPAAPPPTPPHRVVTTLALGEEGPHTAPGGEAHPTTLIAGEEGPTTLVPGEEGPFTNPQLDDPAPTVTTLAVGEEGRHGGSGPFGGF